MIRHTNMAAVPRFVLILSIAASLAVGSAGFGGTTGVSAMPTDCTRYLWKASWAYRMGTMYLDMGYGGTAAHWFDVAHFYDTQFIYCS